MIAVVQVYTICFWLLYSAKLLILKTEFWEKNIHAALLSLILQLCRDHVHLQKSKFSILSLISPKLLRLITFRQISCAGQDFESPISDKSFLILWQRYFLCTKLLVHHLLSDIQLVGKILNLMLTRPFSAFILYQAKSG